ncbi:MAG: response regulator [Alphaproteobacteria bacterium]|nr:response regulator [Alphaproteobacteria bacterium]
MRRLTKTILAAFGIRRVREASTAEEALALIREFEPDIAIVDFLMPGMTGLDFVKLVRGGSDDPMLPIIMLTASSTQHLVTAARDAGVTEFVAKPVSPEALRRRINEIILHPRNFIRSATFFGPDRRRKRPEAVEEDRRAATPEAGTPEAGSDATQAQERVT